MRRFVVATALLGVVLTLTPAKPARAEESSPVRILIVGDSIAQGRVGDWTWRYRLWRSLTGAGASVDFVGPHQGLFQLDPLSYEAPGYRDPGFDQDHAARWGGSMSFPEYPVTDLVTTHAPDVVVNALGLNDLVWFARTPEQLLGQVREFVAAARSADPGVTVVVTQIPEAWIPNVAAYNEGLLALAAELDDPAARVLAAPAPAYSVEDTYDTVHPGPTGEVKHARQVASALAALGLPTAPIPMPPTTAPPPAEPPPPRFAGAARLRAKLVKARRVRLVFTTPAGATQQTVWMRKGARRWRPVALVPSSQHRLVLRGLARHKRYAFRMRAFRGSEASTSWSPRVVVRTR